MYTSTTRGDIPHEKHPELDFMMPVRLLLETKENGHVKIMLNHRGVPTPEMVDGKLVYALPGGGSIVL